MACAIGANVAGLLVCSMFALLLNSSPKGTARGFVRRFGPLLWVPLINLIAGILALMVAVGAVMKVRYPSLFIPLMGWAGASLFCIFLMVVWQYIVIHCRKALLKSREYEEYVQEHAAFDKAEAVRVARLLALAPLGSSASGDGEAVEDTVLFGGSGDISNGSSSRAAPTASKPGFAAAGSSSGAAAGAPGTGGSPRKVVFSGPPVSAVPLSPPSTPSTGGMQSVSYVSEAIASPSSTLAAPRVGALVGGVGVGTGGQDRRATGSALPVGNDRRGGEQRSGDAPTDGSVEPRGSFLYPQHQAPQHVPSVRAAYSLTADRAAQPPPPQRVHSDAGGSRFAAPAAGRRPGPNHLALAQYTDDHLPGQPQPSRY